MAGNSQGTPAGKTSSEGPLDGSISESQNSLMDEMTQVKVISDEMARGLLDEGFKSLEEILEAEIDTLKSVDQIDEDKAKEIQNEIKELRQSGESSPDKESGVEGDDELAQWLTGESDKDINGLLEDDIEQAKKEDSTTKGSEEDVDSLRSWLSGEEESFSDWLGEESFEEEKEKVEEELEKRKNEIEEREEEIEKKTRELEDLRERFEQRVEELESDEFDPNELIEENNNLKTELEEKEEKIERLKEEKEELQEEIDEIKQGSVAMVKYLKSQRKGEGGKKPDLEESKEKLEALKEQNEKLKKKILALKSKKEASPSGGSEGGMEEKDKQLRELKSELAKKEEEIEDLKEQVRHKEDELNEREEDLQRREQMLRKQRKKLEAKKKEIDGKTEQERKRELEELKKEIEKKEQELKAKEKYINQKEKEIKARQEDLLDEELEEREEEILREIEEEKCKTGTGRLDDLLLGGIPLGSNVSVYGPPHVGKNVLINSFIAEGLEKGVPAIWVITDKSVEEVREEMKFVLPTYEEYELRGLVYYVDAYSISMGEVKEDKKEEEYIRYIPDQSDVEAVTEAVDEFAEEIKKEHRYYRMAFESVSTIIAYLDTETTFRILQPFSGRRKRDKAVSLYSLEKGMHTEQDISMLGHIMNGEIEFKVEQLKNFLRVEGLGDVQTRDWIEYNHSKSGISMGSFSLDTIR